MEAADGNPADAPASITYTIESLTDDAMTLDIHFGAGWWRNRFVPVGTELFSYDLNNGGEHRQH